MAEENKTKTNSPLCLPSMQLPHMMMMMVMIRARKVLVCVCGITRQKKDAAHSNLDVNAGDKMIRSTEQNRKKKKKNEKTICIVNVTLCIVPRVMKVSCYISHIPYICFHYEVCFMHIFSYLLQMISLLINIYLFFILFLIYASSPPLLSFFLWF